MVKLAAFCVVAISVVLTLPFWFGVFALFGPQLGAIAATTTILFLLFIIYQIVPMLLPKKKPPA